MTRKRKTVAALAAIVLIAVLWAPVRNAAFALRVGLAVRALAGGYDARDLPVVETKVVRSDGRRSLEALVYRPAASAATRAIVLSPGVSEQGCYHPRLRALARAIANQGFLIVTPDIVEFRDFRISPAGLDEMEFWYRQVASLEGAGSVRKTGIAGISFAGTLALMAAARPAVREEVGFVLAIGPYFDIRRCTASWFRATARTLPAGQYPTRFYAKWLVMRAALDMIPDETERTHLDGVLRALLLQLAVPPPPAELSPVALRWRELAVMPEDREDPALAAEIENHLGAALFAPLDPRPVLRDVRCPVFIVHGSHDDLIDAQESRDMQGSLARAEVLISPFLTHTHPLERKLGLGETARAALEMLGFFYSFAATVR